MTAAPLHHFHQQARVHQLPAITPATANRTLVLLPSRAPTCTRLNFRAPGSDAQLPHDNEISRGQTGAPHGRQRSCTRTARSRSPGATRTRWSGGKRFRQGELTLAETKLRTQAIDMLAKFIISRLRTSRWLRMASHLAVRLTI